MVAFHNNGTPCVVTNKGGRPLRYHFRTVYCFTESENYDDDRAERVVAALKTHWVT